MSFMLLLPTAVTAYGNGEICRRDQPLPARMRDGPFKSHDVALAAGKIALRAFVDLLEFQPEVMPENQSFPGRWRNSAEQAASVSAVAAFSRILDISREQF